MAVGRVVSWGGNWQKQAGGLSRPGTPHTGHVHRTGPGARDNISHEGLGCVLTLHVGNTHAHTHARDD